ncbi:hypothetical protein [Pseudovibrio denitrificans]|nr:hypothetical protein [Pseudovibrio denitrificans]
MTETAKRTAGENSDYLALNTSQCCSGADGYACQQAHAIWT